MNTNEEVGAYVAAMQGIFDMDPTLKEGLFTGEYFDEPMFWELFEHCATGNFIESGDPALTPEQFKDVSLTVTRKGIGSALEGLKEAELIIEESDGSFYLTEKGLEYVKKNNLVDDAAISNYLKNKKISE